MYFSNSLIESVSFLYVHKISFPLFISKHLELINQEELEMENVKENGEKTETDNQVKSVQEQIKAEKEHLGEITKKCGELKKTLREHKEEQEKLKIEEQKLKHNTAHAIPKNK